MTRLWTQLGTGSGTEGEDCGAVSVLNVITWASGGKVGPDLQLPARDPQSVAGWVRYIRRLARKPSGAMLVFGDIYEAMSHAQVRAAFRSAGIRAPQVGYRYGWSFADMRQWLAASPDRAVILPVVYGVARRDGAPMGSTTFNDAHAIVLVGARKRRVKVGGKWRRWWYTRLGDPLMDGRRRPGSLRRYPKGWQTARLWCYRAAAGAFGTGPDGRPRPIGAGRAVVITVERG